jgi:multiple sugar transport system substrate-binding protein
MKKIISILLAVLMLAGLAACSTPAADPTAPPAANNEPAAPETEAPAEPIKLVFGFWGDSGEITAYENAIKGFEAIMPNVTVEIAQYPSTADFWTQLPGQIAAGTAPDIIASTNEGHMSYIVDGQFLPLDSYGNDVSGVVANAVDAWSYDGQLYAYPTTSAPGIFAINMDMWNAAGLGDMPTTWDEVYEAAKVLTTGDVKGLCIDFGVNPYHVTQYVNSFGGGWGGGSTINSAENVSALDYVLKMYAEGLAANPKDFGHSWDGETFAFEKAAMTTAGAWYVGFMAGSAPEVNYAIIPMPGGNGSQGCSLHVTGLSVLAGTKNPDAAAALAYYMSREEAQREMATVAGYQPSLLSLQDWYYEQNPGLASTRASMDWASSFAFPVQATEFGTDLSTAFEDVHYNGNAKTAQEILDALAATYGA